MMIMTVYYGGQRVIDEDKEVMAMMTKHDGVSSWRPIRAFAPPFQPVAR
jgi:hypothetical protein